MSDAPEGTQSATKRKARGKTQARKPRHQGTVAGAVAPTLDDETAAALTLYNTYLEADREQQARERALRKAEKAKNDAAAAVRKLNDRKAPAAETAEAEATYRAAVETLQRLRDGDTAAPDAEDDSTEVSTAEGRAEDAGDTAGDEGAASEDTESQDTEGTASEDSEDAKDTESENVGTIEGEDTARENNDEASVGVEASVSDEDLAGDEPAGVAG